MLHFDVINQTLKRVDRFSPATDSVDYLKAVFDFKTDDWNDKTKYALFRLGTKTYAKALDSKNTCIVPFEVLRATDESKASIGAKNKVFVTLVGEKGTVRVPTNALRVDLETSGYAESENGKDPTPDLYAQYIGEVEAAVAEHAANAANSMNIASEKAAEASESAASLKNDYSNALKGVASGAVVRVDDVSPVEHYPVVKVHGKNLFNTVDIATTEATGDNVYISEVGAGYVVVTTVGDYEGNGYCRSFKTLQELCPQIELGKTYILNATTEPAAWLKCIYFINGGFWYFNKPLTITEEMLSSEVVFYGLNTIQGQGVGSCKILNIQLEEGDTATEYTPYVDPSTVTVTRCGKNLVDVSKLVNSAVVNTSGNAYVITKNGTDRFSNLANLYIPVGASACLSGKIVSDTRQTTDCFMVQIWHTDGTATYPQIKINKGAFSVVITPKVAITGMRIYIESTEADGVAVSFSNLQVEYGLTSTEYELYKCEEYTPNADGTVNGLTSVSPTMTLLTDTEGVTVECEYNQDVNKVVERLKNAIIALGGVV